MGDTEYKADDEIVVTEGDVVAVDSMSRVDGSLVDEDDYYVFYFKETNGTAGLNEGDNIVTAAQSIDNQTGVSMPKGEGEYYIVLVDKAQWEANWDLSSVKDNWTWNESPNNWGGLYSKVKEFTVKPALQSVEGAYAYQGTMKKVTADTTFNYTGAELDLAFAVDGEACAVTLVWDKLPNGMTEGPQWNSASQSWKVTESGTYTATITGKEKSGWTGSEEVTFTVEAIDLDTADVYIAPVDKSKGISVYSEGNIDNGLLVVNGEKLDSNAQIVATLTGINGANYDKPEAPERLTKTGYYTFLVQGYDFDEYKAGDNANVSGQKTVTAYVVDQTVQYAYSGDSLDDGDKIAEPFDMSKGTFFTTDAITATVGGKDVKGETSVTVTKNGEVVTDFTQPGEYKATLDTPVDTENYAYAGHLTFTFEVMGKDYTYSKVYLTWQGKNVANGEKIVYTGSAVDPTVTVKDAKGNTLTEGEDYTVEIQDAKGNATEAVNVDHYVVAVTFNGKFNDSWTDTTFECPFEIVKAEIVSAEATEVYYALPEDGSAAAPAFVGYTEPALKGQAFDLAADDIAVTYYDKDGEKVDAADLTAAGNYTADITVKNTAQNLKGSVKGVKVVVADAVAFSDVDSNAWYAPYVFEAKNLHYMNGVDGTTLFLPENAITRAEIAQVVYNMAATSADAVLPPVDFDDIEAGAWYVRAVSFVNTAGVMTGYDSNDSFGVYDNATREQLATTMYRYAQVTGQDVTVEDEDAALAKYADGGQVADWAKTAMAWAVENGVMGVDVDSLRPQDSIVRAEVAAIAIRVQPQELKKPVI